MSRVPAEDLEAERRAIYARCDALSRLWSDKPEQQRTALASMDEIQQELYDRIRFAPDLPKARREEFAYSIFQVCEQLPEPTLRLLLDTDLTFVCGPLEQVEQALYSQVKTPGAGEASIHSQFDPNTGIVLLGNSRLHSTCHEIMHALDWSFASVFGFEHRNGRFLNLPSHSKMAIDLYIDGVAGGGSLYDKEVFEKRWPDLKGPWLVSEWFAENGAGALGFIANRADGIPFTMRTPDENRKMFAERAPKAAAFFERLHQHSVPLALERLHRRAAELHR